MDPDSQDSSFGSPRIAAVMPVIALSPSRLLCRERVLLGGALTLHQARASAAEAIDDSHPNTMVPWILTKNKGCGVKLSASS